LNINKYIERLIRQRNSIYGKNYKTKNFNNMDVQSLYPNIFTPLKDSVKNFCEPLTKKQIFNLQFKWDMQQITKSTNNEWWDDPNFWYVISTFKCLDEEFIEEYSERVNWKSISIMQNLSENFIRKFKDRLDLNSFLASNMYRSNHSAEFIEEIEFWIKDLKSHTDGMNIKYSFIDDTNL